MKLYHYTCDHAEAQIRRDGKVRPNPQPVLDGKAVSWWTDLTPPDRLALGLTSRILSCDRLSYRFAAEDTEQNSRRLIPWLVWLRSTPLDRKRVMADLHVDRTLPRHWWVSLHTITVDAADL